MKYLSLLFLLMVAGFSAFASKGDQRTDVEKMTDLKKGKLLVYIEYALDGPVWPKLQTNIIKDNMPEPDFNAMVKEVVEKEWTYCPVQFVKSNEEMAALLNKNKNDFGLTFTTINYMAALYILRYDTLTKNSLYPRPIAAFLPASIIDIQLFFKPAIKNLQWYMNTALAGKFNPDDYKQSTNYVDAAALKKLPEMTVYVWHHWLENACTEESLKKIYPYKIKMATDAEIKEAADNGKENIAVAYITGDRLFLLNVNDGTMIFSRVISAQRYPFSNKKIELILEAYNNLK